MKCRNALYNIAILIARNLQRPQKHNQAHIDTTSHLQLHGIAEVNET